jgi:hypothetical protein
MGPTDDGGPIRFSGRNLRIRVIFLADCRVADDLERVHDHRLVWAFKVQELSVVHGDSGELGHCLYRILFSSADQSDRPRTIQRGTAQDDSRGHRTGRVLNFFVVYLKEALKWNYVVGVALIVVAVFVIFKEW